MAVRWIEKNGKRILYIDLRGLTQEEVMGDIEALRAELLGLGQKGVGELLTLTNFSGQFATPEMTAVANDLGKQLRPYIKKGAVVMETSITKKILFQAYATLTGGNRKLFETEDSAIEWLVEP